MEAEEERISGKTPLWSMAPTSCSRPGATAACPAAAAHPSSLSPQRGPFWPASGVLNFFVFRTKHYFDYFLPPLLLFLTTRKRKANKPLGESPAPLPGHRHNPRAPRGIAPEPESRNQPHCFPPRPNFSLGFEEGPLRADTSPRRAPCRDFLAFW